MKQGDRGNSLEDKHAEQPNLSSLLDTDTRDKDGNQNIVTSKNYFVSQTQSRSHPVY